MGGSGDRNKCFEVVFIDPDFALCNFPFKLSLRRGVRLLSSGEEDLVLRQPIQKEQLAFVVLPQCINPNM